VTAAGIHLLSMLDAEIVLLTDLAAVQPSEACARCADVTEHLLHIIEAAFPEALLGQSCGSHLGRLRSRLSECAAQLRAGEFRKARATLQDCRDSLNAMVLAAAQVQRDAGKDLDRDMVDERQQPRPASEDFESNVVALRDYQEEFERETSAFDALLPGLLGTLAGAFVAVSGGQVIDKDEDEFTLAARVERTHRDRFVLIRRVSQRMTQDFLESPEVDMR
jgi:hypothetical protein